jgi:hypothetical protein
MGLCYPSMVLPLAADGGDGLQVKKVPANI